MLRLIIAGSILGAALSGCSSRSKVDDAQAIAAMPAGMIEASARMTAESKRQKSGLNEPRHTEDLAPPGARVGREQYHRIDEWVPRIGFDVIQ